MTDIVDPRTRSRMMSRIRGRDTRPEMAVRRGLHRQGFRYRLHSGEVPGKPDLVLPAFDTAILVHGCFWHCHDCRYFRLPKSNQAFWKSKLAGNRKRDLAIVSLLLQQGWYVAIVWECAFRDQSELSVAGTIDRLADWIVRVKYRRRLVSFRTG